MGCCPGVLRVSFSFSPGFFLVVDFRGRLGGLGGKVGSSSEEFEESESGTWYIGLMRVTESSGLGSVGLLICCRLYVPICSLAINAGKGKGKCIYIARFL